MKVSIVLIKIMYKKLIFQFNLSKKRRTRIAITSILQKNEPDLTSGTKKVQSQNIKKKKNKKGVLINKIVLCLNKCSIMSIKQAKRAKSPLTPLRHKQLKNRESPIIKKKRGYSL